ncbi:MAG: ribonuclease P protein component [Pseudomonadota bacterium]
MLKGELVFLLKRFCFLLRLKRRQDFVRLAQQGMHWVTPGFILQCDSAPNDEEHARIRVGFTASRRIGGAVQRNRAKRRLRAVADMVLSAKGAPGLDYVLVARGKVLTKDFQRLKQDLRWALNKLHGGKLHERKES